MKTHLDPRHLRREAAIKALFQHSYSESVGKDQLAEKIISQSNKIDKLIKQSAPEWPLEKLNRIDLAILRLAIYELQETDQPPKVIIDEAIELAKEYGADSSPRFINGALGAASKILDKDTRKNSNDKKADA